MTEKTRQKKKQGLIDRITNHPFGKLLGIQVGEDIDGEPAFYIEIQDQHLNPLGSMHGGVGLALADTAGGFAVIDDKGAFVTLSEEYHFLKSVELGDKLFAKTRLLSEGFKIKVVEVELMVEEEKVGHSIITFYRKKQ